MKVQVLPSTVKAEESGYIQGEVTSVSQFPVTEGEMFLLLENQTLVDTLRTGDAQLRVDVKLHRDPSMLSGLEWSSSQGPSVRDHPRDAVHGDLRAWRGASVDPGVALVRREAPLERLHATTTFRGLLRSIGRSVELSSPRKDADRPPDGGCRVRGGGARDRPRLPRQDRAAGRAARRLRRLAGTVPRPATSSRPPAITA